VASAGTGGPGQGPAANGALSIVDVRTATTHTAKAVRRTVTAGCGPSRVVASADGQHVWVTAGNSNALLGFAAAKLLSDPGHALVARQTVGAVPLGLILVKHGTRIVIADSNKSGIRGSAPDLAVVSVPQVLAHRPALLGYLATGQQPRQFAVLPGGGTLLVTNTGSSQLQSVDLTHLP
jgi:DNA-binding beta-propeller fold protein YncE